MLVAAPASSAGDGDEILGLIPVNTEDNFLHLLIGIAGIGAGWPRPPSAAPSLTRASHAGRAVLAVASA